MRPPLDPILIHITSTFGIHWYGILIVSGIMLAPCTLHNKPNEMGRTHNARAEYAPACPFPGNYRRRDYTTLLPVQRVVPSGGATTKRTQLRSLPYGRVDWASTAR